MAESFSLEAVTSYDEEKKAWDAVRILAECVEHVQPGGRYLGEAGFELRGGNKQWARRTTRELAVIRTKFDLEYHVLSWYYFAQGLSWSVNGWMYNAESQEVRVSAYGGSDLIKTEEALRTVVQRARERGIELTVKQIRVSSTESSGSSPTTEIIVNRRPMKKWRMFRAWVGPHLAAYIVGIVSSISATVLAIWLGIGR